MTLRCSCWIPKKNEEKVRSILRSMEVTGDEQGSAFLLTEKDSAAAMPPTYFKSTEFTDPSQMLVDTYGVPRYQEANPAFLTSITFPFLFGVMYGDIGHGAIVLLLGLFLLLRQQQLLQQRGLLAAFVPYRYLLSLMGLFAFYAGFLYNDLFALGVDLFGSRWTEEGHEPINGGIRLKQLGEDPYPFGIDPAWKGATNELLMVNSVKMKLSIAIAVVHMGVGVLLKGLNLLFFGEVLSFCFEFVPQLLFLLLLIGYLNFMVVLKWVSPRSSNKPNLISSIINMCMMGEVAPEEQLYAHQQTVERVLLLLLLLTIPVMLLVKPTVLLLRSKRAAAAAAADKQQQRAAAPGHDALDAAENGNAAAAAADAPPQQQQQQQQQQEEHEGAGDLFIFQMIETIEFVLGTVSNTASYLRLWALSLAHQQLSLVFYSQTVVRALTLSEDTAVVAAALFLVFSLFACITFGVILCMDLLEVALHALRLQWVEFQNKFYKGDGHKFEPLDFLLVVKRKAA
ncbi:hypothetical protein ETH_00023405 [Eimeria tenella]|uniref:V-type proton ATPase subunit a n=1 Tax=Eimeria tenella TaxID=5802 RepID=U6L9I7_EIMTE|nr:hypothetical protein ETH_00023405 [Eimeria tenella]CDJ45229.1 hypothetical protein ETH_00023405 [Eimeria tenella]|eukprot:XP_013235976.1 hypothetical protein ETH_00023405 [Eimeria tenella]